MSQLPQGLSPQQITMFQTFFTKVKDASLESKELAVFTRTILGGNAITSRNNASSRSYQQKKAGERTWRDFAGLYGESLFATGGIPGFLEINKAMGTTAPNAISKKVAKIVRDSKNWETGWKNQCVTGWYSRLPASELAEYTLQEKNRAETTLKLYSNTRLIQQVVSFRSLWQHTFDEISYAKRQMKIWNRERREAKKAAKAPMIGGVQMPNEYHLLTQETITQITDLVNDGIMPQYEQWKLDEFGRVSDILTHFDTKNLGKVWSESEMFTQTTRFRKVCNVSKMHFTYGNLDADMRWESKDRKWTYTGLKPDWEILLKTSVDATAENMRLQFIGYMMEKLLPVVAMKKSPLADATNYVDRAPRFGQYVRFNFAFEDDSSFDLEGCVEQSYSSTGLPFFRFPRRFYKATLSDGSMLKGGKMTPFSQMVSVFCND